MSARTPVIGIAFVGVPDAGAERVVALMARVGSRFGLRLERTAELLAAGELQDVVGDGGSFRATLGPRLDVDIRHGNLSLNSRDEILIHCDRSLWSESQ